MPQIYNFIVFLDDNINPRKKVKKWIVFVVIDFEISLIRWLWSIWNSLKGNSAKKQIFLLTDNRIPHTEKSLLSVNNSFIFSSLKSAIICFLIWIAFALYERRTTTTKIANAIWNHKRISIVLLFLKPFKFVERALWEL